MGKVPTVNKSRLVIAFMIFCIALVVLCFRDGYIQIVKGEEYTRMAMEQQTMDQLVEAKRGDIVDRNGNKMAVSTIKYSVWIRPASVMNSERETQEARDAENAEKVETMVNGLAQILGIDPQTPSIFHGCCGAGGAVSAFQPDRQAQQADEKMSFAPDGATVVTMCPTCSYTYAFRLMSAPRNLTNKHYAERLFESQIDWGMNFYQLNSMWYGEYGQWLAEVFA